MTKLSPLLKALASAAAALTLIMVSPITTLAAPSDQDAKHSICQSYDDWSEPTPPRHIYGNTWYVGTCAISVVLIKTSEGLILIDGAIEGAVPAIEENIRSLGFNLRDIKFILVTHEHIDHVGGVARLQKDTGATVITRERTAKALLSGTNYPEDPQAGTLTDFTPIKTLRNIADGGTVVLGGQRIKNIPMPGHAPGGQGWQWSECENSKCLSLVFADSVTSISNDSYKFNAPGSLENELRATTGRLLTTDCDILITGHVKHSNLLSRLDGTAPLVDQNACIELAHKGIRGLEIRLQKEGKKNSGERSN